MVIRNTVLLSALLLTCAVGFALPFFSHRTFTASPARSSFNSIKQPNVSNSFPVRIKIPRINVDAAIENVGITENGAMDIPQNIMDVGWYKFGSVPGNIGSAVMDGHVDGRNGEAGIFALLHILSTGDRIYIIDNRRATTTFIVSKKGLFDPKEDTSDIFNQSDRSHLNLITCSGAWDKSRQIYTKRIVVFTDLLRR